MNRFIAFFVAILVLGLGVTDLQAADRNTPSTGLAPRIMATDVGPTLNPPTEGLSAAYFHGLSLADFLWYWNDMPSLAAPGTINSILGPGAFHSSGDFDNTGTFYALDYDRDMLVTTDINTGAVTDVVVCSPTGAQTWTGLTYDHSNGNWYGSATDGLTSTLYSISTTTGASSIGNIGDPLIISISADNSGQLYGYSIATTNELFYSIDKSTGAGTPIGTGLGFDGNFAQDMDFDPATNTCYLAIFNNSAFFGQLWTVNTSTGVGTLVGQIGTGAGWEATAFGIPGVPDGGGLPAEVCDALSTGPLKMKCQANGTINLRKRMIGFTGYGGTEVKVLVDGTDSYTFTIEDAPNGAGSAIEGQMAGSYAPGDHTVSIPDCGIEQVVNCQAPDAMDLTEDSDLLGVPASTELMGNYPNPFNPSTTISYALSADSYVTLKVYNTLGQEVATLVDGFQTAGYLTATWNGRNDFGSTVSSGIYVYRLTAGDVVQTAKMMFMK